MASGYDDSSDFRSVVFGTILFTIVFTIIGVSISLFLPREAPATKTVDTDLFSTILDDTTVSAISDVNDALNVGFAGNVSFEKYISNNPVNLLSSTGTDKGLELYRDMSTRTAVEWFYLRITGNREITNMILENADREDIPLSLAFALAYTESRYNTNALNYNVNGSVDRGLFQLNNRSFPHLDEADFFNPEVSAGYGMKHLRYCMNVAGNDLTALAMYNAGVTRVRKDQTPKSTLIYVSNIVSYKGALDRAFEEEVVKYCTEDDSIVSFVAKK
jgi:hypothetical protein